VQDVLSISFWPTTWILLKQYYYALSPSGLWVNSQWGHFHHIFLSTWGVFSGQVQVMCLCLWLWGTKQTLIMIKKPESAWKLSIGNHIYKVGDPAFFLTSYRMLSNKEYRVSFWAEGTFCVIRHNKRSVVGLVTSCLLHNKALNTALFIDQLDIDF